MKYYNDELTWLRSFSPEFSAAHPQIAGYLDPDKYPVSDAHVERLIEAFALLNAQLHQQLDHESPLLMQTLSDLIYPHYQSPIPSMSIVQITLPSDITTSYTLSKNIVINSDSGHGEVCTFSTVYPVTLWPIQVSDVSITGQRLRLTLSCNDPLTFQTVMPDKLCFYLNAPHEYAFILYEWLMHHTNCITIAEAINAHSYNLDISCLKPIGFDRNENILPSDARTFMGYHLLSEFFNCPEKFLFFELRNLKTLLKEQVTSNTLHFFFDFDEANPLLEKNIQPHWFSLGCTPIINLFQHTLEPIALTHTQTEYHLIPDKQRPAQALEIHSLKNVFAIHDTQAIVEYFPLYTPATHKLPNTSSGHWHTHRRPATSEETPQNKGTELFLICMQRDTKPAILHIDALCSNRHLPSILPFGGNAPKLSLFHEERIFATNCLIPFTKPRWPSQEYPDDANLIAHLLNNEHSLADNEKNLNSLQERLRLYSDHDINGLVKLVCKPALFRYTNVGENVSVEGIQLILDIDENKWTLKSNIFLFGCLLERFLALSCSINTFTQLTINTRVSGKQYYWPPRSGEQILQ